jgi:rhodanese-related sulfurtransferase
MNPPDMPVTEKPLLPPASDRRTEVKRIVREALLLATAGAALAFAANALSPRGLTLTRNYFPGATNGVVAAPALSLITGIKQKGLQWLDGQQTLRLFNDPRLQQQLIVFIDARNQEQYREGHIPGAYVFDPYYPEKYIATVLPVCQVAEQIVVYCNGGDCEDSQFAAIVLRDAGIPNQRLLVYVGGLAGWATNGLPVETGERNSGNIRKHTPARS